MELGEKNTNSKGYEMEIVEILEGQYVKVRFFDGSEKKARYSHFLEGNVKAPCEKLKYGNMLGEIEIDTETKEIICAKWRNMFKRAYSDRKYKDRPDYMGVSVCDRWFVFKNFYEDYIKMSKMINIPIEDTRLDKDIKIKGNKLYSPETCVIVDNRINSFFKIESNKKYDMPPNIKYLESGNRRYLVRLFNEKGKSINKTFETLDEACKYRNEKKKEILLIILQEYVDLNLIEKNGELYNILFNYEF